MSVNLKVKRLSPDATVPTKAHEDDLGWDLYASRDVDLRIGEVEKVHTDVYIEFPNLLGAIIEDRSSMAERGVKKSGGVLDPGYRGEIKVLLTNTSVNGPSVHIKKGQKIAQLVLTEVIPATMEEVDELADSDRGIGGFGSTGT